MALLKLLSATAAVVSDRAGTVASYGFMTRELLNFFRNIGNAIDAAYSSPGAITPVFTAASPMTFTAASRMAFHIRGGTVNSLTFVRNGFGIPVAVASVGQLIELNPGDQVVLTYTVAPTINTFNR
jgi:hypothetical protein